MAYWKDLDPQTRKNLLAAYGAAEMRQYETTHIPQNLLLTPAPPPASSPDDRYRGGDEMGFAMNSMVGVLNQMMAMIEQMMPQIKREMEQKIAEAEQASARLESLHTRMLGYIDQGQEPPAALVAMYEKEQDLAAHRRVPTREDLERVDEAYIKAQEAVQKLENRREGRRFEGGADAPRAAFEGINPEDLPRFPQGASVSKDEGIRAPGHVMAQVRERGGSSGPDFV